MTKTVEGVTARLIEMGQDAVEMSSEMKKLFGMDGMRVLGINQNEISALAEQIGIPSHELALGLWKSDLYEAKVLACMLADPCEISEERFAEMAKDVKSWVLIDLTCSTVISRSPAAMQLAHKWSESDDDRYVYAGFRIISDLAASMPKGSKDEVGFFDSSLFTARKQASRANPYVPKAVSSALRMIGLRDREWHEAAVETCREIAMQDSRNAKWVASQTLADLLASGTDRSFG